jgi:Na+/proline symporter/nitrogen-specific signal transduction histidine kinase
MGILFLLASVVEKKGKFINRIVHNPLTYSLSLAAYCTAWTFYGSVGRAATQGVGFLPIYLGPAIVAPILFIFLRKMVLISKNQRITSIADFISSRYGKSSTLGILVTLVALVGIIPYISIQLKAITLSFEMLKSTDISVDIGDKPFYFDSALYITIALTFFAIIFGTRNLDPNERHDGLVTAVAFESLIKLVAFLAVGIFVTFGIFDGFGDLFEKSSTLPEVERLFSLESVGIQAGEWFGLIFISMFAVLLLPRQFHLAVVENTNPNFLSKASWIFPLYLFLINIFVIPIAIGGLYYFQGQNVEPDTFVISLPLALNQNKLAVLAALGGFSAASSMVIVAALALSIMISNNLILPTFLNPRMWKTKNAGNITAQLLGIRRVVIVVVLLLSYSYYKTIGNTYTLVSMGLISFAAIAQFVPAVVGGIYWKRATKAGAVSGLLVGFVIWFITLPFPTLIESGLIRSNILEDGFFGLDLLRPYALFGLEGLDEIVHSSFWSLLLNVTVYITVSLNSRPTPLEVSQADLFVDIHKYRSSGGAEYEVFRRQAKVRDLELLLFRFLGKEKTRVLMATYARKNQFDFSTTTMANADLVNYVEKHLTGAIGAASAKVIIQSIAKEEPISLEEMFKILDQTQQVIQYSRALEKKSAELEKTTIQLRQANEQLKALDQLKADFITTVTHELRTPITSIKALSRILKDNADLPADQQREFLEIIVKESERITRLINQVLDLEKVQAAPSEEEQKLLDLRGLVQQAYDGLTGYMKEKEIEKKLTLPPQPVMIKGHPDQLTQVVVNLLSNAVKFSDPNNGKVSIRLSEDNGWAQLEVEDNGKGISGKDHKIIFDKFTQLSDQQFGKPKGSGLGLFISKTLVEQHKGRISIGKSSLQGANFIVRLPLSDPSIQTSEQQNKGEEK